MPIAGFEYQIEFKFHLESFRGCEKSRWPNSHLCGNETAAMKLLAFVAVTPCPVGKPLCDGGSFQRAETDQFFLFFIVKA
jgi:hypothetical protein